MSGATKTEWTVKLNNGMCNPMLEIPVKAGIDGLIIGRDEVGYGKLLPWNELMVAKLRAQGCEFSDGGDTE